MTRGSLKSRLGGQKAGHQGSSSYPKEFQLHPKGQQKICSCFSLENDRGAVAGKRRGCWITSGRETSHPPAEALPQEPRGTLAPSFTPLLPHCTEHPAPFNQPRMQHAQERVLFSSLYPFVCLGEGIHYLTLLSSSSEASSVVPIQCKNFSSSSSESPTFLPALCEMLCPELNAEVWVFFLGLNRRG